MVCQPRKTKGGSSNEQEYPNTHDLELQVSHCIYPKISSANHLWTDKSGHRRNTARTMQKEGDKDYRSKCMQRSHPYVCRNTAKVCNCGNYGIPEGKSSLMIFDRHANLKYKYGNRHFWCRGYYVDTVGRNEKKIAEYVRNQLQEDALSDQIGLREYFDPFAGEQVI